MNHPTEEEFILHYYSEAEDLVSVEQHLSECESCRTLYGTLERSLNGMDALAVPERGPGYEARVWARLAPCLPARPAFRLFTPAWSWAAAGAALAALLVLAFLAGRSYPRGRQPVQMAADSPPAERVWLTAVGNHLERSQMVLTELANASTAGPLDISFEQERAADLLDANRLYRQSASDAGDAVVAGVLDELERILLEIEHAPSRISPAELDELRLRLRGEGILFKLRVLGSTVQNQEERARQPL